MTPEETANHPLVLALNEFEQYDVPVEVEDAPLVKGARVMGSRSPLGVDSSRTACANAQYAKSPDRGAGDDVVPLIEVVEKPWHRILVFMAAQGKTPRQQCEMFNGKFDENNNYIAGSADQGRGFATIQMVNRQPWFKQRVIDEIVDAGKDELAGFFEAQVMPSLNTLVELRDGKKTPPSVRLGSVKELLDRFLGKSTQPYQAKEVQHKDPEEEAKQLEREIAALEKEI